MIEFHVWVKLLFLCGHRRSDWIVEFKSSWRIGLAGLIILIIDVTNCFVDELFVN